MKNVVGLFGVAFDPLPSREAVVMKQMYIRAHALGKVARPNYSDGYGFFTDKLPESISGRCSLLGEVPVPTWLQPKPQLCDAGKVSFNSLACFMQSGGCSTIANGVHDFVQMKVLPMIPGMIGVDHSSTYGAISALKANGDGELGLIVIDSHFDGVPSNIRHALIGSSMATDALYRADDLRSQSSNSVAASPELLAWSDLNPENFLLYILKRNLISPKNLIVVGIADYPGNDFPESDNPHSKEYVKFFRSLEQQGTCFIPKSTLHEQGTNALAAALKKLSARRVYLSLDIDVGSLSSVYACRFLNTVGLTFDKIQDVLLTIFNAISGGKILAGFDLMEVDIHKLGAKIDSLHIDRTEDICISFLDLVGSVVQKQARQVC